ncbi:MAG: hypothetical protein ACRCZJ_09560 [Erysipelotrichaceae bacterium]
MEFMHIGAPVNKPMPNEVYNEGMKVWIAEPDHDHFKFEYLRFDDDSWLAKEIQTQTHIAVKVDSVDAALATCEKVLLEPVAVNEACTIAFGLRHGVVMEFMQLSE